VKGENMDYHGRSAKEQMNIVNQIKTNSNQLLILARLNNGQVIVLSDGREVIEDLKAQLKMLDEAEKQINDSINKLQREG
jgi:hypothetical protein